MAHTFGQRDRGGSGSGRWRALALLAVTLVLSITTWFSAVIPQLRLQWDLSEREDPPLDVTDDANTH